MTTGVKSEQRRASGQTVAEEIIKEEAKEADEPVRVELPEERARTFRTPGFSRMRISWTPSDAAIISQALAAVDGRILNAFADAYHLMHELFEIVREPVLKDDGTPEKDKWGFTVWARTPAGGWVEDFTKLTLRQKENFVFQITTRIFEWEQRAADVWGEAMFAKAAWEERFSIGFDAPMSGTVDDRRAAGNIDAREERYFAIFASLYSRRADAIVRSMGLLGQRIKDSLTG